MFIVCAIVLALLVLYITSEMTASIAKQKSTGTALGFLAVLAIGTYALLAL